MLNDVLGLRDCSLSTPMHFADQRELFVLERAPGCHRLELQRCLGPCAGQCTQLEYLRRVAQARAFLAGDADEPIRWLSQRMADASERWDFEHAASLRDRIARLEMLREEFGRLREALESLSFVYRVAGHDGDDRLYVIRRGTVRAVLPAPATAAETRRVSRAVREIFRQPEAGGALVSKHQVDEILLLAHWFRTHPEELSHTTPPAAGDALPLSA